MICQIARRIGAPCAQFHLHGPPPGQRNLSKLQLQVGLIAIGPLPVTIAGRFCLEASVLVSDLDR